MKILIVENQLQMVNALTNYLERNGLYVRNTAGLVLTKKEYKLLLFFASNPERLLSKTVLAENIWGDNRDQSDSFDFLYSQIKNLRRKLIGE